MNSNTCLIDTYPYGQFLRDVRTRKVFRSVISSKTFTVSPSGNSELKLPHALRIPNYFTSPLPPTPPHAFRIPVQQPPPHSPNFKIPTVICLWIFCQITRFTLCACRSTCMQPQQGFYLKPGPGYLHPSTLGTVPAFTEMRSQVD